MHGLINRPQEVIKNIISEFPQPCIKLINPHYQLRMTVKYHDKLKNFTAKKQTFQFSMSLR